MEPLTEVRLRLLDLHRILLDLERVEFERRHGRVTPMAYFQALTHDPSLAWLRPLTSAIVSLDELLEQDGGVPPPDRVETLRFVRALLTPGEGGNPFHARYADALQECPEVVLAHAAVLRLL